MFGFKPVGDKENARAIISQWKTHTPSKAAVDSNSVNFLQINKSLAHGGLTGARDVTNATRGAKEKQACDMASGHVPSRSRIVVPFRREKLVCGTLRFGVPSGKSLPMKDVIGGGYGDDKDGAVALSRAVTAQRSHREVLRVHTNHSSRIYRGAVLHRVEANLEKQRFSCSGGPSRPPTAYTVARFRAVTPKVDCRR